MLKKSICSFLVLCILSFFACSTILNKTKTGLSPETTSFILTNNLPVILNNTHQGEEVWVALYVNSGFMHQKEDSSNQGVAHFLEHVILKGTELDPETEDYTNFIKSLGGYSNAFTWYDRTHYEIIIPSKNLLEALPHHAALFSKSLVSQKAIIQELQAVKNESSHRKKLDQGKVSRDLLILSEHPQLKYYYFGSDSKLESLKRDDFVDFFNTNYHAENMILVVSGNLDGITNLKNTVTKYYKDIPSKPKQKRPDSQAVTVNWQDKIPVIVQSAKQGTHLIEIAIPTPRFDSSSYFAFTFLLHYLERNESLSLINQFIEKRWATKGTWSIIPVDSHGLLTLDLNLTEAGSQNIDAIITNYFSYFKWLHHQDFSSNWLNQEITYAKISYKKSGHLFVNQGFKLALNKIKLGIDSKEELFEHLSKVTGQDIQSLIKNMVQPNKVMISLVSSSVKPEETKVHGERNYGYRYLLESVQELNQITVKDNSNSKIFVRNPYLKNLRLDPLNLKNKKAEIKKSKNSLWVWQENHDSPQVSFQINLKPQIPLTDIESTALEVLTTAFNRTYKQNKLNRVLAGSNVDLIYSSGAKQFIFSGTGFNQTQIQVMVSWLQGFLSQPILQQDILITKNRFKNNWEHFFSPVLYQIDSNLLTRLAFKYKTNPEDGLLNLNYLHETAFNSVKEKLFEPLGAVISAYGDITEEDLTNLENQLSQILKISPTEIPMPTKNLISIAEKPTRTLIYKTEKDRSGYMRLYQGPSLETDSSVKSYKDQLAFWLLSKYISDRSYQMIRTEKGLAYDAKAWSPLFENSFEQDSYLAFSSSALSPKPGFQIIKDCFEEILSEIHNKKIDETIFSNSKTKLISNLATSPNSHPVHLARLVKETFLFKNKQSFEGLVKIASSLTKDDLFNSFNYYIDQKNHLEIILPGQGDQIPKHLNIIPKIPSED